MKNTSRGFTVLELLVVIAIIGILSGMILVSLSSSKTKAKDARVISAVSQTRSTAALLYIGSSNSYDAALKTDTACPALDPSVDDSIETLDADVRIQQGKACSGASTIHQGIYINVSGGSYLIAAGLPSSYSGANATAWWCVDGTGQSKKITTNPASPTALTVCP